MRTVRNFVLLALFGGMLMFVAHFAAFLAASLFFKGALPPPYWWPYPILYPLAAAIAVRRGALGPLASAAGACLLPAIYFLALGLFESNWGASNTALLGVGIAFVLAVGCSIWARKRHPKVSQERAPVLDGHVRASLWALAIGAGALLFTFSAMMGFPPVITFALSALVYLSGGLWMGRTQPGSVWYAPLLMSVPVWVVFVPMGMQFRPPVIRIWYFLTPPVLGLLFAYAGMFIGTRMSGANKTNKPSP